jgi:hypothetical protein
MLEKRLRVQWITVNANQRFETIVRREGVAGMIEAIIFVFLLLFRRRGPKVHEPLQSTWDIYTDSIFFLFVCLFDFFSFFFVFVAISPSHWLSVLCVQQNSTSHGDGHNPIWVFWSVCVRQSTLKHLIKVEGVSV